MSKYQLCQVKTCRNYGRYCRLHLQDVVKEKKPIVKMSNDRKAMEKEYQKLRKEFLRQNPFCSVKGCGQPATDIHHSKGRVGSDLLDVKNFVALCRKHHQYFEIRPLEAKEKGISKSRLQKVEK